MDNIFRVAVCDDNEVERVTLIDKIREYLKKNFQEEMECTIDEYDNGITMLNAIIQDNKQYNVLFQDIEMNDMNGIEVVNKIKEILNGIHVIYVSAHNGYIFETYKTHPVNYLIKPLVVHQLFEVLNEIKSKILMENNFYNIEISGSKKKVYYDDILYFERIGNSISLFTSTGKKYEIYKSVKKIASELNQEYFIQINQGCLVNVSKINVLEKDVAILVDGMHLPISRRLKSKVKKEFFEKVR